jgi:hypothetical protein
VHGAPHRARLHQLFEFLGPPAAISGRWTCMIRRQRHAMQTLAQISASFCFESIFTHPDGWRKAVQALVLTVLSDSASGAGYNRADVARLCPVHPGSRLI